MMIRIPASRMNRDILTALILLSVVCFAACAAPHIPPSRDLSVLTTSSYPESVIDGLTADELKAQASLARTIPIPASIPYREGTDARKIYIEWYRRGFSYAWLKDIKHLAPSIRSEDPVRRPILDGWYRGHAEGYLKLENQKIDEATDRILSLIEQNGAAETSMPLRIEKPWKAPALFSSEPAVHQNNSSPPKTE